MSVSRKGGSSIGGVALSVHRLALTKEALMIGRYEPISSHVASPACEKECRNVLLPAFWSPRSRKVKALEPRAQTLENGEESGTISSTSSSCRSGWVNEARWIQPLGVRSRVRAGCTQHRVFAIARCSYCVVGGSGGGGVTVVMAMVARALCW
jgi:hypothetical protein